MPCEIAEIVEATGQVDYINTSIGVATASLFMIEASMHIPPGYAMFIPSAFRKAVDLPVVGVGRFKDPLQAERASPRGTATSSAWCAARSPTPTSRPRRAPAPPTRSACACRCNQECVGRMGLNRWLGCIENPRTGREAARSSAPIHVSAQAEGRDGRRRRPGRAAGRDRRGPQRPPRHRRREGADRPAARCASPPACPTGPSSAT